MVAHAFKKSSLVVESAVLRMGFLSASNYTSRLPRVKVNKAFRDPLLDWNTIECRTVCSAPAVLRFSSWEFRTGIIVSFSYVKTYTEAEDANTFLNLQ